MLREQRKSQAIYNREKSKLEKFLHVDITKIL